MYFRSTFLCLLYSFFILSKVSSVLFPFAFSIKVGIFLLLVSSLANSTIQSSNVGFLLYLYLLYIIFLY